MSDIVIKVENLSKQYRLGEVSTGAMKDDLNRLWAKIRGKEDPYLKIGEVNNRAERGNSDYVWALRDIDFEVKQGEVLGIIGKNGAGKSTLLKLLSRTTLPTTGRVRMKGRIASLLEVGTGFHPELTGRQNIFLNGSILGMNRHEIRSKLDEIVDFSGVERYLDTPVKRYSSGMYVRLAFAVAAHLDPDILIVDEVLAVGDAEFQKKAIGKMKDVSTGQGRTVLFVSHNMGSIENLCDYGVVLKNGMIAFQGSQTEAISEYLTKPEIKKIKQKKSSTKSLIAIESLDFFDASNNKISFLKSGCAFKIVFKYRISKNCPLLKNIHFSVSFINQNGVKIFTHSNRFGNTPITISDCLNNKTVSIKLDNIPLPRGIYEIDTSIVHGNDVIDQQRSISVIEVIDSPFGNNIINPHPVHGACLVQADWNLR